MPRKKKTTPSKLASDLAVSICPPAPILAGEDEKAYNELLAQVSATVKPKDAIEEVWVRDVVDMTWEIFRHRAFKASLIKTAVPEALEEIVSPVIMHVMEIEQPDEAYLERNLAKLGGHTKLKEVMGNWTLGMPDAVEKVNTVLGYCELTMEDVNARALMLVLQETIQIDMLLDRLERSRNGLIQDIERRRAALAEALRQAMQDLDSQSVDVATDAPVPQDADG